MKNGRKILFSNNEDVILEFKKYGLTPLEKYVNVDTPILCGQDGGYLVYARLSNLKAGQTCRIFHKSNPYSVSNMKIWIERNNKNFMFYEEQPDYKSSIQNFNFICVLGHIFLKTWSSIYYENYGCPYCSGQRYSSDNSFAEKYPEKICYFKNKNDAYENTASSCKKIIVVCPKCNSEKDTTISRLVHNGFTCKICCDGISFPEKFLRELLKYLRIKFISQKSFDWSERKIYDFFIFPDTIIEIHGEQHYKDIPFWKTKYKNIQENDEHKMRIALENGIINYINIDGRNSSIDCMRQNFIYSLNKYFDMSNVEWNLIYKKASNSLKVSAWELWNEGFSCKEISNKLKIRPETIGVWLNQGNEIKVVNYNGKLEQSKAGKRTVLIRKYNK